MSNVSMTVWRPWKVNCQIRTYLFISLMCVCVCRSALMSSKFSNWQFNQMSQVSGSIEIKVFGQRRDQQRGVKIALGGSQEKAKI